jgi:hypothetical protein
LERQAEKNEEKSTSYAEKIAHMAANYAGRAAKFAALRGKKKGPPWKRRPF